jgi:hypothetical protein
MEAAAATPRIRTIPYTGNLTAGATAISPKRRDREIEETTKVRRSELFRARALAREKNRQPKKPEPSAGFSCFCFKKSQIRSNFVKTCQTRLISGIHKFRWFSVKTGDLLNSSTARGYFFFVRA